MTDPGHDDTPPGEAIPGGTTDVRGAAPPTETSSTLLDTDLLARRRLALGLSERELARRLGVTATFIRGLESGANHDELLLPLVLQLCTLLALDVSDVLRPRGDEPACGPRRPDSSPGPSEAAEHDEAHPTAAPVEPPAGPLGPDLPELLGALLVADRRLVPLTDLAVTTGRSVAEVRDALTDLGRRLPGVGMRLHRRNDDASVVGAPVPHELDESLGRRSVARRGLTHLQARLLHAVLTGTHDHTSTGNAERAALGALVNAGLLVPGTDGRGYDLHPDIAYSLGDEGAAAP